MSTITIDLRAIEATDEATRLLGQVAEYALNDVERRDQMAHAHALAALAIAVRLGQLVDMVRVVGNGIGEDLALITSEIGNLGVTVGALAQTVAEAGPR